VLRAVAILLVIGRHGPAPSVPLPRILEGALETWHRSGWTGVDLFFVLSGFLISGLLFKEYKRHGDIWVGRFFIRRGFKLYPAFYALIGLTAVIMWSLSEPLPPPRLIAELLYVQNYFAGMFAHTWSLAVEEQFYLLIGLMLFWSSRRSGGARDGDAFHFVPRLFPIVALVCLVGRIWTSSRLPFGLLTHHYPLHLRLDSLFFGVFLGWVFHFRSDTFRSVVQRYWKPILVVSAVFVSPAALLDLHTSFFMQTIGLTLLYAGFGGFLAVSVVGPLRPPAVLDVPLNLLARIGVLSYSIYLWHLPTAITVGVLELSYGVQWIVYVGGSILFGFVAAELVEMPFLKLRDRLFPSRSGMIRRIAEAEVHRV
jgi:peptidoglycan/LPS O-acetylase OafA/YrhL